MAVNDKVVALCALVFLAGSGCNDGTAPNPVAPTGAGLGASCGGGADCRAGLTCSAENRCAVATPAANLAPCYIGPECASGQCVPNGARGRCGPAGKGEAGTSCTGDGNCASGLRCALSGQSLFPVCVTAGTKDIGAECTGSKDCLQGLLCQAEKCAFVPIDGAAAPNGLPPFVPLPVANQWQGATCPARKTTGPITALWQLPRDTDPMDVRQDFFRLPFPNDAHRSGGRVDYTRFPKEPTPQFGFDLLGRYTDRLATEPFSNFPTVTLRFDGAIKFDTISLDAASPQLRFVDLTTGPTFGNGRGLQYVVSSGRNRYLCNDWFALKPLAGDSLPPGTYAVIMKRGVKDSNGGDVVPSADFTAMLTSTAPSDPRQAAAWPSYEPLRRYLNTANLSAADLLTATVFTVGDPTRVVKSLAQSVAATGVATADPWVKCGTAPSPCPDAKGDRACGTSTLVDEWHTLLELPIFQQGAAPYLTPAEGGDLSDPDQNGLRIPVRREKVCAALVTPKGTPPPGGWPLVLYGHGTGGSFRSHAGDGSALGLAAVSLADGGTVSFATLGFDQVGHGPRRGARQDVSPNDVVFNFSNPASARGTMAQGAADLFSVTRFARAISGAADAGIPPLDATRLGYWGHSQGASEGGLFLAFDRSLEVAVLTGASGSLTDSLTSKKAPVNIADGLAFVLGEPPLQPVSSFHPVLTLLANWTDPVDALHFGRRAAVTPADGATPAHARHFFVAWGKGDLFTPSPVQRAYAQATGAAFVGPKVDETDLTPVTSATGNVRLPRPVTSVMRQYEPSGYDGHYVAFQNPAAKSDVLRFFARAVRGEVPVVPEP